MTDLTRIEGSERRGQYHVVSQEGVILIIDDDVDYASLVQVALQEAGIDCPVQVVHDGIAALDYLSRLGPLAARQPAVLPALILLDLKMPRLNGLELLHWMRNQAHLADVPVLLFTGIEPALEQTQALGLGATSLHIKPFSYRELLQEMTTIGDTYLRPRRLRRAA